MYCVQTDTKLISGPAETRLAFRLNSKNFKSIRRLLFQSLCISGVCSYARTLICDCLQPTNNPPQILQSRCFLFLPPASLGLISPLLKRTEVKLQRTYSHGEHIAPLSLPPSCSLPLLGLLFRPTQPTQTRPVVWDRVDVSPLSSSLTRQNDSFSYYCNEPVKPALQSMMACKQWNFRANVFILENTAVSLILRIIGKLISLQK